MLQPSENFGAEQIRFLQKDAQGWIIHANAKIIEAASNGLAEADIDITERSELGNKFWKGGSALIEHFKSRGFGCEVCGQSYVKISW